MALCSLPLSIGLLTATTSDISASQPTTPVQMGSSNISTTPSANQLSRLVKATSQSGRLSPLMHSGQTTRRLTSRPDTPPSSWPMASSLSSLLISPSPPSLCPTSPLSSPPLTSLQSVCASSKNTKPTSPPSTPTSSTAASSLCSNSSRPLRRPLKTSISSLACLFSCTTQVSRLT